MSGSSASSKLCLSFFICLAPRIISGMISSRILRSILAVSRVMSSCICMVRRLLQKLSSSAMRLRRALIPGYREMRRTCFSMARHSPVMARWLTCRLSWRYASKRKCSLRVSRVRSSARVAALTRTARSSGETSADCSRAVASCASVLLHRGVVQVRSKSSVSAASCAWCIRSVSASRRFLSAYSRLAVAVSSVYASSAACSWG